MRKLVMAIPKGRILNELGPLLSRAEVIPEKDFFDESSRKLIFATNRKNLDLVKVRSFDVATFVRFGGADLGICGSDVLEEFPSQEIFPVLDLEIGKCRLSIAGKKNEEIGNPSHLKIATKYVAITNNHFSQRGVQAETIKLNGSIEIATKLNLCDLIVDLVSSGKTLAENQMFELEKIMDVSSHLLVNRAALKTANEEINEIIKAFDAAIL